MIRSFSIAGKRPIYLDDHGNLIVIDGDWYRTATICRGTPAYSNEDLGSAQLDQMIRVLKKRFPGR